MPKRNRLHIQSIAAMFLFVLAGCATPSSPFTSNASSVALPAVAPGRAVWFWGSAAQQAIVATPSLQAQAIANFKSWNVTSVYGSYSSQIASTPAAVRAWNATLAANGIASYSLVSSDDFFLPEQWTTTQTWIETNFLSFNAASKPGEGFVGIAFDVEPAAFTGNANHVSWNSATPALRRTYLTDFSDMLLSTRSMLNANSSSKALIQTYLVQWFSNLNGSVLWANAADQAQWYTQLAQTCDRITVEEYETSSTSTILSQYQASDTLLNGKSRIALNSADAVWASSTQFFQALGSLEAQTNKFGDIEDYDTTAH